MKKTVDFQYRCLQCNKIKTEKGVELAYADEYMRQLSEQDAAFRIHKCDESRTGILQLIGYQVKQ